MTQRIRRNILCLLAVYTRGSKDETWVTVAALQFIERWQWRQEALFSGAISAPWGNGMGTPLSRAIDFQILSYPPYSVS